MSITIAWGSLENVDLGGSHLINGRRFELLSSGTMLKPCGILRGVMGLPMRRVTKTRFEVLGPRLVIAGQLGTRSADLRPFRDELVARYQIAQLQFSGGTGS